MNNSEAIVKQNPDIIDALQKDVVDLQVTDENILEFLVESSIIHPVYSEDGSIYVDEENKIYVL